MRQFSIINADVLDGLRSLPDESVHCCVTSPPYWGLRDYGTAEWNGGEGECDHAHFLGGNGAASLKQTTSAGTQKYQYRDNCGKCGAVRIDKQLGLERTPEEYVAAMVGVFREVRRVLRADGTCWVNLGDSYTGCAASGGTQRLGPNGNLDNQRNAVGISKSGCGLKNKDLVGIPWRVAFALQADGWYLRSDIIWHKPNPMPESVTDRPTKAHEYLFLLTKSARYFYDAAAIAEVGSMNSHGGTPTQSGTKYQESRNDAGTLGIAARKTDKQRGHSRRHAGFNDRWDAMEREGQCSGMRNKRTVWSIATEPYAETHFAVMPTQLVEPCVMAGCPEDGTVLDPFAGSGTVGVVALRHARDFIGIELNPTYAEMARNRIMDDAPMFNTELVLNAKLRDNSLDTIRIAD